MSDRKQGRPANEDDRGGGRSSSSRRLTGLAAISAGLVLVSVLVAAGLVAWSLTTEGSSGGPKTAAIVDQLSLTVPNQTFVTAATGLLEEAGYSVDYYSGEEITVDFYKSLPTLGYDFIVMRTHSGLYTQEEESEDGADSEDAFLALFTNESYNQYTYIEEQAAGRIGKAFYREGGEELFAIGPGFVSSTMEGRFDDTMIVMMGCDGLGTTVTAESFIEKGAKAFISWSQPVTASHTDAATEELLEKLLIEGLSTADAVERTAAEVGPDPAYGAELRFVESGG